MLNRSQNPAWCAQLPQVIDNTQSISAGISSAAHDVPPLRRISSASDRDSRVWDVAWDEFTALDVCIQTARAVAHLHHLTPSIIHRFSSQLLGVCIVPEVYPLCRDIKPSNYLVRRLPKDHGQVVQICLADFGSAVRRIPSHLSIQEGSLLYQVNSETLCRYHKVEACEWYRLQRYTQHLEISNTQRAQMCIHSELLFGKS